MVRLTRGHSRQSNLVNGTYNTCLVGPGPARPGPAQKIDRPSHYHQPVTWLAARSLAFSQSPTSEWINRFSLI